MATEEEQHAEFLRLLAANTNRIYAFVRILVLNNENEAEEIFQITCMTLWKKFSQYDPEGDFGAWACRMAHFEALKLRDSRRKISFLSDQAIASLAEAAMPIADRINERRDALAKCIEKLNESDLEMVKLRYFDAKKPKEIAARADRSVHAVYRELTRVHGLLRRCVNRSMRRESV